MTVLFCCTQGDCNGHLQCTWTFFVSEWSFLNVCIFTFSHKCAACILFFLFHSAFYTRQLYTNKVQGRNKNAHPFAHFLESTKIPSASSSYIYIRSTSPLFAPGSARRTQSYVQKLRAHNTRWSTIWKPSTSSLRSSSFVNSIKTHCWVCHTAQAHTCNDTIDDKEPIYNFGHVQT